MYNYQAAFEKQINQIKSEGRYRNFIGLQRKAGEFPKAIAIARMHAYQFREVLEYL